MGTEPVTHRCKLEDTESVWLADGGTCCHIRFTTWESNPAYSPDKDRLILEHKGFEIFNGMLTGWQMGSELDLFGRADELDDE